MNASEINEELAREYLRILESYLPEISKHPEKLSGVFFPKVSENYSTSHTKIMLVGKETRGWLKPLSTALPIEDASEYVRANMDAQSAFLLNPSKRSQFLQYYREVSKTASGVKQYTPTAIWSNLFCMSFKSKSPTKSKAFAGIKKLSKELLHAQIRILKPDVILFTTGTTYDKYLRAFFRDRTASKPIVPKQLWSFKVEDIQCYRTSHPQCAKGAWARKEALRLAANPEQRL